MKQLSTTLALAAIFLFLSFTSCEKEATAPEESTKINPPSDLNITVISNSRIQLGWKDNSDNEDGFQIERRIGPSDPFAFLCAIGRDTVSCVDSGLASQTTYFYRVRAFNAKSYSEYSNEANTSTPFSPQLSGNWLGTTSQNLTFRFSATGSTITSINLDVRLNLGMVSCTYGMSSQTPAAINPDSTFEATAAGHSGVTSFSTTVRGKFISGTKASGIIDAISLGGAICGGSLIIGTGLGMSGKTWEVSLDLLPPTVSSVTPLDNAINVGIRQLISATFGETMDAASFTTETFLLTSGERTIPGTVSCSGTTAKFIPSAVLDCNTPYKAVIKATVRDRAGNTLGSDYSWTFTSTAQCLQVVSSFKTPGYGPLGLWFDGTYLWHTDIFAGAYGKVYKMTTAGDTLFSFNAPYYTPRGVVFDGTHVWVSVDGFGLSSHGTIYKLTTSGSIVSSFSSPSSGPEGLELFDGHLWNADRTANLIYKIDMSGNVISSFPAPAYNACGIAYDGTYLWLADNDYPIGKIYKLDLQGNVIGVFDAPDTEPVGLAFDGTYLWSVGWKTEKIYKLTVPKP